MILLLILIAILVIIVGIIVARMVGTNDYYLDRYVKDQSHLTNLTPCYSGDCASNPSKATLEANTAKLREYMHSNDRGVLMVWAPWCPHCHSALPKVADAARESACDFAVCNSELVQREAIAGDVLNVPHFPYIVLKENGTITAFDGSPTIEGLKNFSIRKLT